MDQLSHELLVDRAAAALPPQQFRAFRRLARELAAHENRWGLFLLQYEHRDERDTVSRAIQNVVGNGVILHADARQHPDWPSLEAAVEQAAQSARLIQVFDLDAWLDTSTEPGLAEARLHAWNVRREAFARAVSIPVVCWMRPGTLKNLAQTAPDLWAWRAGVHNFSIPLATSDIAGVVQNRIIEPQSGAIDNRTIAQRTQRLREIRQYLQEHAEADNESLALRGMLFEELAKITNLLGHVDEALRIRREEQLPVYDKLGDVHLRAVTMGQIADLLKARGELDEAMRIYRYEALPVYDKLGDVRSRAVTMGKIADILQVRGEFDEALRIRREEELPVYDKLGDARARAFAMSKIADILGERGELDEALRIHREETLPVYDRLGDAGERAVAMGKIADILRKRGELDEALLILREDVLAVFDKLGDVHSRAVTMSRIAGILRQRGELDEALRIYREETLMVYEKLGDPRELLISQANLAAILIQRANPGDIDEARQLLETALHAAKRMRLPEADVITKQLQRLLA